MSKNLNRPQQVRTTEEELEVLTRLQGTVVWAILKRVMQRYIDQLKTFSYNLPYSLSGEDFKVKHRETTAQALGFKRLIKLVETADKKLEEGKR